MGFRFSPRGLNRLLAPFKLEVRALRLGEAPDPLAWAFPWFVEEAAVRGMDVNDFEEAIQGWEPAEPCLAALLDDTLPDDAILCEIGPGTGRFSRHLARRVPRGTLHLVEHSPWLVRFLQGYFEATPVIRVHGNDGASLAGIPDGEACLVCSFGTFVALKLGAILSYAREARRVLRPGGLFVFDYIDLGRPEAWDWLEANSKSAEYAAIYTYHDRDRVLEVLRRAGLTVEREVPSGYRTWLVARSP